LKLLERTLKGTGTDSVAVERLPMKTGIGVRLVCRVRRYVTVLLATAFDVPRILRHLDSSEAGFDIGVVTYLPRICNPHDIVPEASKTTATMYLA
jgi:hypothetical protein